MSNCGLTSSVIPSWSGLVGGLDFSWALNKVKINFADQSFKRYKRNRTCSTLNGNNGSWTNTDDVEEEEKRRTFFDGINMFMNNCKRDVKVDACCFGFQVNHSPTGMIGELKWLVSESFDEMKDYLRQKADDVAEDIGERIIKLSSRYEKDVNIPVVSKLDDMQPLIVEEDKLSVGIDNDRVIGLGDKEDVAKAKLRQKAAETLRKQQNKNQTKNLMAPKKDLINNKGAGKGGSKKNETPKSPLDGDKLKHVEEINRKNAETASNVVKDKQDNNKIKMVKPEVIGDVKNVISPDGPNKTGLEITDIDVLLDEGNDPSIEGADEDKFISLEDISFCNKVKSRCKFTTTEITDKDIMSKLVVFDCKGAPLCGYVASCVGMYGTFNKSNHASVKAYYKKHAIDDDPLSIGRVSVINDFVNEHGFNLMVVADVKSIHDAVEPADFVVYGTLRVIWRRMYDLNAGWIILKWTGEDSATNPVGHFVLMVYPYKTKPKLEIPLVKHIRPKFFIYIIDEEMILVDKKLDQTFLTDDLRYNLSTRNDVETDDATAVFEHTKTLYLNVTLIKAMFAVGISVISYLTCQPLIGASMIGLMELSSIPDRIVLMKEDIEVSIVHANAISPSLQVNPEGRASIMKVLNLHHINVNSNTEGLLYGTTKYLNYYADEYAKRKNKVNYDLLEMNQYNQPTNTTEISKKAMRNVENVIDFIKVSDYIGFGKIELINDDLDVNNFVIDIKPVPNPTKINVKLATAPCGTIYNNGIPLGPGMLPVTDQTGIIAAFVNRSMNKPIVQDLEMVEEFKMFFKRFYSPFIEQVESANLVELDPLEYFEHHYTTRGNKTKEYVEGIKKQYNDYLVYQNTRNKVEANSAFVKLENSAKKYDKSYKPKPRLIMVMSIFLLVNYCQILRLVDLWNEGPMKKYQIKHMDMDEMIEKIMDTQDCRHNVTDFSSFECSIAGGVRECENWLILKLLKKARFYKARRAYIKHIKPGRILKSQGVKMFINTRNSGDFHTSFGNGFINLAINQFLSYKYDGKASKIIVEGDDGIIPSKIINNEIINKLNFEFSDSVSGCYPGDTDFLRKRYLDGKQFLNVGRVMSCMWVKENVNLKLGKRMFILRCIGCSLHYQSPGHPILFALVNRIGRMTHNYKTPFNNFIKYLDYSKIPYIKERYPLNVTCDESMRHHVATGAVGFPPIPIPIQLTLEKIIMEEQTIDLFGLLDNYPEIEMYTSTILNQETVVNQPDPTMLDLNKLLEDNLEVTRRAIVTLARRPVV